VSPGWLPGQPRALVRRRTLPYTPGRRRRSPARRTSLRPNMGDTELMLFDQVRELPVATVRRAPRSQFALLVGDLQRWMATRWRWFRPRTVPVLVAFAGMLGVLQAVDYLSHPQVESVATATEPMIYIDGTPYKNGTPMPDLEGTRYHVRLVVQQ
jgi:hypothetical protein